MNEEPILNEHGIQTFDVTAMKPYWKVFYTENTSLGEIASSIGLHTDYGETKLMHEIIDHFTWKIENYLASKVVITGIYEYFQKKVNYRKNIHGEPYISYDWYRKPVEVGGMYDGQTFERL